MWSQSPFLFPSYKLTCTQKHKDVYRHRNAFSADNHHITSGNDDIRPLHNICSKTTDDFADNSQVEGTPSPFLQWRAAFEAMPLFSTRVCVCDQHRRQMTSVNLINCFADGGYVICLRHVRHFRNTLRSAEQKSCKPLKY